ncbi:MAG: trypsin-like serine peptidase [Hyphomicrobiaceae bacterium]
MAKRRNRYDHNSSTWQNALCASLATFAAVAGSSAIPALAIDDMRPGIIRNDDRQPVLNGNRQWHAVGHINISGFRSTHACTGTMIAPNVVLTAAHCVIDPWSKKVFRPGRINFRAGVTRGAHVGHAVGRCVKLHNELRQRGAGIVMPNLPDRRIQIDNVQFDLAVIVLDQPIKEAPPLPIVDKTVNAEGLRVTHASYPADRRFALMAHRGCRVKSRVKNLWVTDCDTHAAGSGGPLILEGGNGNRVVAVMAGVIAKKATIAIPVSNWQTLPLDQLCPAPQ